MFEILLFFDNNLKVDFELIQSFLCFYLIGNVLKEIVELVGVLIQVFKFQLGDFIFSVLELWGVEYQESNVIFISVQDQGFVQKIADRERCSVNFVGIIIGEGRVRKVFGGVRGWNRLGYREWWKIISLSICIMKNNCLGFILFYFCLD